MLLIISYLVEPPCGTTSCKRPPPTSDHGSKPPKTFPVKALQLESVVKALKLKRKGTTSGGPPLLVIAVTDFSVPLNIVVPFWVANRTVEEPKKVILDRYTFLGNCPPSPPLKPTFCPRELSAKVGLGEGWVGRFPETYNGKQEDPGTRLPGTSEHFADTERPTRIFQLLSNRGLSAFFSLALYLLLTMNTYFHH